MQFQLQILLRIAFTITCYLPTTIAFGQTTHQLWDKAYGGSDADNLYSMVSTSDGGYILGGYSYSAASGDKSGTNQGNADYWVVKLDVNGNKLWDRTFGGSGDDSFTSILQTADGGYILGGYSNSAISGSKTEPSQGGYDYWVVKLDGNGNKLWDKSIGGTGKDLFTTLVKCPDGGYILAGYSESTISGNKTQANKGGSDYWIVKLDGNGNQLWDKTIGGSAGDEDFPIISKTLDGGYILGGASESPISGDKTEDSQGGYDYWIVKLDESGNILWDKTIGGTAGDDLRTLFQTSDGGYIIGGSSESGIGGDKSGVSQGIIDYWVVKLDEHGNKIWDTTIGGSNIDLLYALVQTPDGGYVLGGTSESGVSGDKTAPSKGGYDYWLIKLDSNGIKLWDKTIGGSSSDELFSILISANGDYVLGGRSASGTSGDRTQASQGSMDYWILRLQITDPVSTLPVKWLYFKGKTTMGGNQLDWATVTEKNSDSFVVERSVDGRDFMEIASIRAAGNSSIQKNYTYLDRNISSLDAWTVYYRLKQIDFNGLYEYTQLVAITNGKVAISTFPNPFISSLEVKLPQTAVASFQLSNAEGKIIYAKNKNASSGIVQLDDLPQLTPGIYIMQVTAGKQTIKLKIIKQ